MRWRQMPSLNDYNFLSTRHRTIYIPCHIEGQLLDIYYNLILKKVITQIKNSIVKQIQYWFYSESKII